MPSSLQILFTLLPAAILSAKSWSTDFPNLRSSSSFRLEVAELMF